jgi:hypothetical protein
MLWLIPVINVQAQIQVQTGISQAYDDNPFRLVEPVASWISIADLGLQYDFDHVSLSYEGSFTRFDEILEHNFYWHQASLFGGGEKIKWSMYFEQSINGMDYTLYDHTAAVGTFDYQLNTSTMKFYGTGIVTYNYYPQLSEVDNFYLHTNIRFNKSFRTRTSLLAGLGISYKYYPNSTVTAAPVLSLLPSLSGQGGGYRGGFGGNSDGSYQIYSSTESSYTSQLQWWVRLAQSITSFTGLALQYKRWITLDGYNRYVSGIIYDYNDESALFDDPMGYELRSVQVELTQLLLFQSILKLGYERNTKNYNVQGIYTDQETYRESPLREDQNEYISVSLRKSLPWDEMLLDFELLYQWLLNNSNSYWYNYRSNNLALQINLYF